MVESGVACLHVDWLTSLNTECSESTPAETNEKWGVCVCLCGGCVCSRWRGSVCVWGGGGDPAQTS